VPSHCLSLFDATHCLSEMVESEAAGVWLQLSRRPSVQFVTRPTAASERVASESRSLSFSDMILVSVLGSDALESWPSYAGGGDD
jgi:hypothetical protein